MKRGILIGLLVTLCLVTPVYGIGKIDWIKELIRYQQQTSIITYKDVVYKEVDDIKLTLDVMMPTEKVYKEAPILVYVHGGGFVSGNKLSILAEGKSDFLDTMLANGYAVVSINYRILDGETIFPSNIEDVQDALAFISQHAHQHGADPENIGLWGTSAGGHLALMGGFLTNDAYSIQYVINHFGPTDFNSWLDEAADRELVLFGTSEPTESYLATLSPVTYVTMNTVPTLTMHGTDDETVNINQAINLDEQFDLVLNENHILSVYDGLGHGLKGSSTEDIYTKMMLFIESNYNEVGK